MTTVDTSSPAPPSKDPVWIARMRTPDSSGLRYCSPAATARTARVRSVSIAFFKDPADPKWRNDKGFKLYRSILRKYAPGKSVSNGYYMAGMASAYAMTQALRGAGRNLTRAGLMRAVTRMNLKDPFTLPGMRVKTSATDRYPLQQAQLQRWKGGRWRAFGKLVPAR